MFLLTGTVAVVFYFKTNELKMEFLEALKVSKLIFVFWNIF